MSDQLKVLLLDDEQGVLEIYRELFRQLPSQPEVQTAISGARALALLDAEPFQVLVLDLRMPRMDGLQVLSIVRRKYPQLRTAILTGVSDENMRSRAYALGVDLFLEKPNSPKEMECLLDCMESLLGEDDTTGFRGVQSKALVDLVQLECLSQSSSVLKITQGACEGKIWIQEGEVVDAAALDLIGEAAFQMIMGWKTGNFEILAGEPNRERVIRKSTHALILETVQSIDEAAADPHADDHAGVSPLAELGRLPGVEFVMSVSADSGEVLNWGLENPEQAALWSQRTAHRMSTLGEFCGWGNWQDLQAKGHQRHVGLLPHNSDTLLCAGFERASSLDQIKSTVKLISAKWTF